MPLSPAERSLRAKLAAESRWATTSAADASEQARVRQLRRHESLVDPDGVLHPAERHRRAQHSLRAEMARLALRSAKARRQRREAAAELIAERATAS